MADVTISLGTESHTADDDANKGDKVTFHNAESVSIDLTLPTRGQTSPFAPTPTSPVTIPGSGNAGPYTVTGNANGEYDFNWKDTGSAELGVRTGKIRIG